MKVRASVKKICDKCKIVHRKRVVRVICVEHQAQTATRIIVSEFEDSNLFWRF